MKGLSKQQIDKTFLESLVFICIEKNIPLFQTTLAFRFFEKGKMLIQLCSKGIVKQEIPLTSLLTRKMVGLRFGLTQLEKLFKTVHNAFMIQTRLENPARISLVLYESEKGRCPCIGILQDEKVLKTLRVSDVIQAIELESEQLN
jgi:hypothetical protein